MKIHEFVEKFQVKIPKEYWEKIVILCEDTGQYRFSEPIEHEEYSGFFYIPGFENYAISKKGVLIGLLSRVFRKWSVTKDSVKGPNCTRTYKGGYRKAAVIDNHGQRKNLFRHRALGLAFIPFILREKKMIINHINGIPGDDRLENLEWCTYSENAKHAYDNDLYETPRMVPVHFRNWKTGEEKKYRSKFDCMREVGKSDAFITQRIKAFDKIFDDGLDFKLDDGRDWPTDRKMTRALQFNNVIARNVFTGTISIYESLRRAAEVTGVSEVNVYRHCEENTIVPTRGYNFRYFPTDEGFPVHSDKSLQMFRDNPVCCTGYGVNTDVDLFIRRMRKANGRTK